MKKIIVSALIATLLSMLSVGCSSMSNNPVSIDNQPTTAIGELQIVMEKSGRLGKVAAIPTIMLVSWDGTLNWDSVPLVRTDTLRIPHQFTRKQTYTVSFHAINPSVKIYEFNGGNVTFTVPDSATFSVTANLNSSVTELYLPIVLKESPAATARRARVIWSVTSGGSPFTDSCVVSFTPGSKDTVVLTGLMQVDYRTVYGYHITVDVDSCADGSGFSGSGDISLSPSTDYSLTIPLTKHGGTGSAGSFIVALNKKGQVTIGVTWN